MTARSSGSKALVLPILLLLLIVGAGIAIALQKQQKAPETPPSAPEVVKTPFDDLPPEEPPVLGGGTSGRPAGTSSMSGYKTVTEMPDLSGNRFAEAESFSAACARAVQADELFEAALAAREKQDWSAFKEQGIAAKGIYEEVLEATSTFVDELADEHGAADADVRGIARARSFWEDRRAFLHRFAR